MKVLFLFNLFETVEFLTLVPKLLIEVLVCVFFFLNGSDPELIFLTDGASKGVMQMLNTIIRDAGDGVIYFPI